MLALLELANRADVQIAVLPLKRCAHAALEGSFALLQDEDERTVYLDGLMGGRLVRDDHDLIADYARRFERMCAAGWTEQRAARRLLTAAETFSVDRPIPPHPA